MRKKHQGASSPFVMPLSLTAQLISNGLQYGQMLRAIQGLSDGKKYLCGQNVDINAKTKRPLSLVAFVSL